MDLNFSLELESEETLTDVKYGFYDVLTQLRKNSDVVATNLKWEKVLYAESYLEVINEDVRPINFTLNILDCISQEWVLKNRFEVSEQRFNEFINPTMREYVVK